MKTCGKKAVVIKPHKSDDSEPLMMTTGEVVKGQEKKTEWEGWLWCRNSHGRTGWIPKNYLQRHPKKPGYYSALRDYNAKELNVNMGQIVYIVNEESGWALVKTASQNEGWVPLRNLSFQNESY